MHIIYMHRSTPWLFFIGVYKCICGLTAVFFVLAKAWQPAVAMCGEWICFKEASSLATIEQAPILA